MTSLRSAQAKLRVTSSLLLGICTPCGEPIFRHRLASGRQISCEQLRRIDQAFKASDASAQQSIGATNVVRGYFDRSSQDGVR